MGDVFLKNGNNLLDWVGLGIPRACTGLFTRNGYGSCRENLSIRSRDRLIYVLVLVQVAVKDVVSNIKYVDILPNVSIHNDRI